MFQVDLYENQALLSAKDMNKKLKCLLQFLFGALRFDYMSKLVHRSAFRTPKFYIAPYDKINH